MPYTDRTGDVWRVTLGARYANGQVQMPSFNLQIVGAGVGDSRGALANQVNSLATTHLLPLMSPNTTYLGCKVSATYTTPPYEATIRKLSNAGLGVNPPIPTQMRPVIGLVTELVGPFYRGRLYGFSPDSGRQLLDGSPNTEIHNAWINVLDVFRAGLVIQGSTWQLVLVHRKKKSDGTVFPVTPVILVVPRDKWGGIRRSGQYGKVNADPW